MPAPPWYAVENVAEIPSPALLVYPDRIGRKIEVWLDVDAGQHRSGVEPGDRALALYRLIHELPGTEPGGLHVYDGQVRERELAARIEQGESAFAAVAALAKKIVDAKLPM